MLRVLELVDHRAAVSYQDILPLRCLVHVAGIERVVKTIGRVQVELAVAPLIPKPREVPLVVYPSEFEDNLHCTGERDDAPHRLQKAL